MVRIALLGRFASSAFKDGLAMWPGGVVIFFSVVTNAVLIAAFLQEKKSAWGSLEAQPAEEASVNAPGEDGAEEARDATTTTQTTTTTTTQTTTTEGDEAEEAGSSEDA